jgi:hypothetical protein
MPLAITCDTASQVLVTANPVDDAKNPEPLDGNLTVSVTSGDGTFTLVNQLSFQAVSGTALGDTVYSVTGDGDLGPDVTSVTDTVTLTVVEKPVPQATSLGLVGGAVTPKPTP